MSPSETTAQTQAQDEAVLEPVDGGDGDGEGNRSQFEAKDDAALLVCLYAGYVLGYVLIQVEVDGI